MPRPSKAKAIERLRRALDKVSELKELSNDSSEFEKWHRNTRVAIENTFGKDSTHVQEFDGISFHLSLVSWGDKYENEIREQESYLRGLQESSSLLESMIGEIEEYWREGEQQAKTLDTSVKVSKDEKKIFVVHGRDDAAREAVARFLEKLELEPIILDEKSNRGRTIIQKFEDYADVKFAVVLLTPDDLGALKDRLDDGREPRARQNVIFELGFFIGKLNRSRVCTLVKGNVKMPSDYKGIGYTVLDDAGGWKTQLVDELKAAGFDIDANRMFDRREPDVRERMK